MDAILVLTLCFVLTLQNLPERSLYTIWSPSICDCYPGSTSRLPVSGGQQGLCCGLSGHIYLHTLKLLPVSLASSQP